MATERSSAKAPPFASSSPSTKTRVRLGRARTNGALEGDPACAKSIDDLADAIFARGAAPRRVAEAVAADVVGGLKAGRSLAEIARKADSHPEVYRVGVEEAPRVLGLKSNSTLHNGEAFSADAFSAVKAVSDGAPDQALLNWADSLCASVTDWKKRPRPQD